MSEMENRADRFPPLGTSPSGGTTNFCVWAPAASTVEVLANGVRTTLAAHAGGLHSGPAPAQIGDRYRYSLDGGPPLADPCSREQPEGLLGDSRVLDATALRPERGPGVGLADLVVYELHVGTFTPEGTFDAAIPRLRALRELGVTAIEIMPVATFPGTRGWGYDGVYTWAPQFSYGGPDGLTRLITAAHRVGLAVLIDVVYNHLGAGADKVAAFGPYFTDRHATIWGKSIDYSQPAVREWAIQNAEMWIRDYRADGLRLDAVHAILDESTPHLLRELRDRVKDLDPRALVISEMELGDLRPIEQWGHDAQWHDGLHHALHALLTGERDGYYSTYGTLADVAAELRRPQRERLVVCGQNHDQVGNRPFGDRLRGADLRLAASVQILSSATPMLFAGEEYDESRPFTYFTDHLDPEIAQLTREGRRAEFSAFPGFAGELPDCQALSTFTASRLDPQAGDPRQREHYRLLLEARRRAGSAPAEVEIEEDRMLLRLRRGPVTLIANFSEIECDGVAPRSAQVRG